MKSSKDRLKNWGQDAVDAGFNLLAKPFGVQRIRIRDINDQEEVEKKLIPPLVKLIRNAKHSIRIVE